MIGSLAVDAAGVTKRYGALTAVDDVSVQVGQGEVYGVLGPNGAQAQCDKGGPKAPDHGPGADWICLMRWTDPNVPLPDGSGRFELNVHSNDCYTAGGPSKLVGLITITDKNGKDVDNPVFEFDGCFDPDSSNRPTGVDIPPPPPASPSPPATKRG